MLHIEQNEDRNETNNNEMFLPLNFLEKISICKSDSIESFVLLDTLFRVYDKGFYDIYPNDNLIFRGKINFDRIEMEVINSNEIMSCDTKIIVHLLYYKKINDTFYEKSYVKKETTLTKFLNILYENYKDFIQN